MRQLLFIWIFSIFHIISCQKFCQDKKAFPADGQTFYIKYRGRDQWLFGTGGNLEDYDHLDESLDRRCTANSRLPYHKLSPIDVGFLKEEDLASNGGKYEWKWHDCGRGRAVFELLGGYDYHYYDDDYDYYHGDDDSNQYLHDERFLYVDSQTNCSYIYTSKSGREPCKRQKQSLSDITNRKGLWKTLEIYVPQVCFYLKPVDTHCNCGTTVVKREYWHEVGISNTRGTQRGVTATKREEVQIAIKATASASGTLFGIGAEVGGEVSDQFTLAEEIAKSFLQSSSITWLEKTTRKVIVDIPGKTCSTLYQAVANYGPYSVEATNTQTKETKAGRSCQK